MGYEGGGLCRGWEALAGYLANFARARRRPEAGKLLPGTRHPYQPKLRCGRSRLADLQAELEYNQRIIADFGTQKNVGDWQQGEFSTTGGVKWFAVGRGQSPRGLKKQEQRPDYIVIDDLAGATR